MAASLEEVARRAVSELEEAVRLHKQSERYHARHIHRLKGTLKQLREECDRLGVELVVEHKDPEGGRSVNHGSIG